MQPLQVQRQDASHRHDSKHELPEEISIDMREQGSLFWFIDLLNVTTFLNVILIKTI